jgi:threonine dehydratase
MNSMTQPPSLAAIEAAAAALAPMIVATPTLSWDGRALRRHIAPATTVSLKLEAIQHTGSFKARSALLALAGLDEAARARGVTAVSAGNHAMAVAFAAARFGSTAKVVMPQNADEGRIAGARALGAEVVLVRDVHAAFEEVERIVADEGRTFVHPFEGPTVATGTGTIGLEMLAAAPTLDAVILPIGGGGLCAGIAAAIKQRKPNCEVFGVEPTGADSMHRSFASGRPEGIERVATIADSLGAPHAAPYSFALCRRFVDDLVAVDDDALCRAMEVLHADLKLAVEPAGAASTAALLGPLRTRLAGRHVGVIVCGANIAPAKWAQFVGRGQAQLAAEPTPPSEAEPGIS